MSSNNSNSFTEENSENMIEEEVVNDNEQILVNDNVLEDEWENKITIKQSSDNKCATYIFNGEGHTIGNLLRSVLQKDKEVDLASYSISHPSENIMNLRLQTKNLNTNKVLGEGLKNICKISDDLKTKFINQLNKVK